MALWGKQDSKTAAGTIAINATTGVVTGSSTNFDGGARVGDYIVVSGEHYQIVSITDDTTAKVRAGIPGATMTAVSSGTSYSLTEKPAFVTTESAGTANGIHGNITKVHGVDTAEVAAERQNGTPVAHAGWVRTTTGSGGRAGRVFNEVLVAMGSITGDLEDVVIQDLSIVIGTQPANDESATGQAVTFEVVATTVPTGGTITYQWQLSEDAGDTWANISAAGVYSDVTTDTLAISDNTGLDGNQYRCVLSATGATSVNSSAATLTEAA